MSKNQANAPSSKTSQSTPVVAIDIGDWLDVMDNEGTWNVAQILKFPTTSTVEVAYDGWGHEYNEIVPLNGDRIAPFHTYTWSVKCWAKYKNWPWWPSIVTFRPPGNEGGQAYLTNEKRLFVDFLDNADIAKRCRCWIELSKIEPFDKRYDKLVKGSNGVGFESSLQRALKSRAGAKFSPLVDGGTLPAEFATKVADPVKQMRKAMGVAEWIATFNANRTRHCEIYVYPKEDTGAVADQDHDVAGALQQLESLVEKDTAQTTLAMDKEKAVDPRTATKRPVLNKTADRLSQSGSGKERPSKTVDPTSANAGDVGKSSKRKARDPPAEPPTSGVRSSKKAWADELQKNMLGGKAAA